MERGRPRLRGRFVSKRRERKYDSIKRGIRQRWENTKIAETHSYSKIASTNDTIESDDCHSVDNVPVDLEEVEIVYTENVIDSPRLEKDWRCGRRLIELGVLADGLSACKKCGLPLQLSHCQGITNFGLSAMLKIPCMNSACKMINNVPTGKRHNKIWDANTKLAAAVQHTGIGFDQISGILAELNMPPISRTLLSSRQSRDWKSYRMYCFLIDARSSRRRSYGNKHIMTMEGIVKFCPITKETWEARAEKGNCGGLNSYHCLSDNEDRKWERCIEKALIKEGNCPIFTSKGFIDWKPCDMSMSTCPNSSYVSDEVYKYPGCFGNNSMFEESSEDYNKAEDMYIRSIIGIVLGIMFILVAVLIVVIVYMRRKMLNPETEGKVSEQLTLIEGGGSEEVVKKNYVKRGLSMLLKEEVRLIVVIGTFGNSVFTTSRRISEAFKNIENFESGRYTDIPSWECRECRYTDIPNTVAENTILFVYGWFGMWNDDLCSVGMAKTACKSLKRILDTTNDVKVIVGIRSDLHKKYHKHLTILFRHKIYLDTTNCEHLKAFLKNIQEHCEENGCACKRLKYEMFRKGKDKVVGIPLKLNVIQRYHELIPNYLDNWDILKVMQDHFTLIERDGERKHVYEWVMYICFKGKFSRPDPFDTNLVEEMMFEIKHSSFDENDATLQNYIRMRNSDKLKDESSEKAQYVFWHPFIYICAFHHLFHKDPEFLIQHCNVDAILQLVRPRGTKTSYFEVTADDRCVTLFNERIRLLGKEVEYARNPLVVKGTETAENEQLIVKPN